MRLLPNERLSIPMSIKDRPCQSIPLSTPGSLHNRYILSSRYVQVNFSQVKCAGGMLSEAAIAFICSTGQMDDTDPRLAKQLFPLTRRSQFCWYWGRCFGFGALVGFFVLLEIRGDADDTFTNDPEAEMSSGHLNK